MQDLSVGNRGISLYCNAVLLAVLYQFQRSVADVAQDLVNHRFDLSGLQQALNVSHLEIGNTDCFQLSGLISVLQCSPGCSVAFHITVLTLVDFHPGLGRVNDHHIQIIQSHFCQGLVDACGCGFVSLVLCCHLGYHEQFLSGYATGSHTFSHTTLVAVGLCGIDMTVAQCHCCLYCLCRLVIGNKPGSQSQLLDLHTII